MGFWAGIKHALNSTLGTEGFKPLDKIIEGQRTLAASDNVIRVIAPPIDSFKDQKSIGTFTPKVGNSIRVSIEFSPSSSENKTVFLYVIGGGETFSKNVAFQYTNNGSAEGLTENALMELDVPIKAGVTYGVSIRSTAFISVVSCRLCASITDTNLVEV